MAAKCQRRATFVTVAATLGIFFVVERIRRLVNVHLHCIVIRQQPEKDTVFIPLLAALHCKPHEMVLKD